MTGAVDQPSDCPACGATSLTRLEPVESWVCDECSYVLESDVDLHKSRKSNTERKTMESKASESLNWDSQIPISDKSEANLVDALSQIEELANSLPLSEERTIRAGELTATAWKINFMHGRSQERTIGAVIYAVSREANAAIPPGIIARNLNTDKQSIKQVFQKLNQELELAIGPPVPTQFVEAICVEMEITEEVQVAAQKVLQQNSSEGGNPIGIAAAAIYIAGTNTDSNITFSELAQAIEMSKETVWRQKSVLQKE